MWLPKLFTLLTSLVTDVEKLQHQMRVTMSAQDSINAAMAELREEVAASVQQSKDQAAALADLTTKLAAGVQGQDSTVDIAATAMEIHEQAMALKASLAAAHTGALAPQTANAGTSVVQGGSTTGPDVVSASSPGVIIPPPSGTEASNEVPSSLGGGAMPATSATDGSTSEKAPGEPVPSTDPNAEPKPAEPAVPSVEDVPSDISENAPESTKKG
jgi:hypothetical protein